MTTRRIALSAILLSLAMLFCTLRPSGAPGGPSGPISDDERMEALDDISTVVQDSMLPEGQIDRQTLLGFLQKDSRFEAAGEAPDGSIWANFEDGRMVIIAPEIPPATGAPFTPPPLPDEDSTSGRTPTSGALPDAAIPDQASTGNHLAMPRTQAPGKYELPKSEIAVEMTTLEGAFSDASTWFHRVLKKYKYTSNGPTTATIEELAAVQNVGVFYLTTHGGMGCLGKFSDCLALYTPSLSTPGPLPYALTYALWTSTPVTPANLALYSKQVDAKLLAYMLAKPGGGKPSEWRYGITTEFIRTRMTFSANSLVFIDACESQTGGLPEAFKAANASWLIGWTHKTHSGDRPFYFIDRMLGVGLDIYEDVPKDEPPNRPFDVSSVMAAMRRLGNDEVIMSGDGKLYESILAEQHLGGAVVILRPSIQRLVVDEAAGVLEIQGGFGSEQGSVTIDNVEVAVKQWESDKIRVSLPAADTSGGSGNVVVKVRNHESNAVPLTLWHVKFTYTEGPEQTITASQNLYLDLYWRADVHRYRTEPDGEVHDQESATLLPADASSGSWDCDWNGSYAGVSIKTIVGQGELPFTRKSGAIGFNASAKIEPAEHAISHLDVEIDFDDENTCVTESTVPGYSPIRSDYSIFVLLPSLLDEFNPDFPVTGPLELDDEWMLVGENRDLMHDGSWPWLKWENTAPKPGTAPDPEKTHA